jgi:hypothetical protein
MQMCLPEDELSADDERPQHADESPQMNYLQTDYHEFSEDVSPAREIACREIMRGDPVPADEARRGVACDEERPHACG